MRLSDDDIRADEAQLARERAEDDARSVTAEMILAVKPDSDAGSADEPEVQDDGAEDAPPPDEDRLDHAVDNHVGEGAVQPSVAASTITPEAVRWIWPSRIAAGMLNVLAGPAGSGKSTILYDVAARLSRDGGTVLIATAEDHLSAVVRPRLEAASADLDRVHVWTAPLILPTDLERLEGRARELSAVLVTVDPLVAFLHGRIDTHKDSSVRQALAPLATMAEAIGCAVVTVIHTNKSATDDPLFRISGSGAFAAAARHVLLACADPDDEEGVRRVLAVVKSNLAEFPPPLGYRIAGVVLDADGLNIPTSRIEWGDEIPSLDPRSLLRPLPDDEERLATDEAADFLRVELAAGPRPAKEVLAAAKRLNLSAATVKRARARLGVRAKPLTDDAGRVTGWRLELPPRVPSQGINVGGEPLDPLGTTSANRPPESPGDQRTNAPQRWSPGRPDEGFICTDCGSKVHPTVGDAHRCDGQKASGAEEAASGTSHTSGRGSTAEPAPTGDELISVAAKAGWPLVSTEAGVLVEKGEWSWRPFARDAKAEELLEASRALASLQEEVSA